MHESQGSTVHYAAVNLGSKLLADGQVYVAVSRVRSLDGLEINELDFSKLTGTQPCKNNASAELQRL